MYQNSRLIALSCWEYGGNKAFLELGKYKGFNSYYLHVHVIMKIKKTSKSLKKHQYI